MNECNEYCYKFLFARHDYFILQKFNLKEIVAQEHEKIKPKIRNGIIISRQNKLNMHVLALSNTNLKSETDILDQQKCKGPIG